MHRRRLCRQLAIDEARRDQPAKEAKYRPPERCAAELPPEMALYLEDDRNAQQAAGSEEDGSADKVAEQAELYCDEGVEAPAACEDAACGRDAAAIAAVLAREDTRKAAEQKEGGAGDEERSDRDEGGPFRRAIRAWLCSAGGG